MRIRTLMLSLSVLASPALAAPMQSMIGSALPTVNKTDASVSAPVKLPARGLSLSWDDLRRNAEILNNLKADGPSTSRSLVDERIYKAASPGVVLIANDQGLGSGAVINASGLIITNYHVVGKSDHVKVVFKPRAEGAQVTQRDLRLGTVIKRDEVSDLALVQVDSMPAGTPVLQLGTLNGATVGQDVFAIGHPLGEEWTYTRGIISQVRRGYSWENEDGVSHKADVIQTQTPINPGNSGGPLLDRSLRVLGLNSFKNTRGEGMNYAISADDITNFLNRSGDRYGASRATAVAQATSCEWKVLGTERKSDPPTGIMAALDVNCSGQANAAVFYPDDASQPAVWMFNDPKSGKVGIIGFDPTRDGNITYALIDSEGTGKPNLIAYYNKGEFPKWSRIEPYNP